MTRGGVRAGREAGPEVRPFVHSSFLTSRDNDPIVGLPEPRSVARHDAADRGRGRASDNAARDPSAGSRKLACGVERREAQRLGGRVSQALRSSPARASGRASQARPNGDSQNPFRQGATVFGGNAGHHKGPRKPLAPPGAPFPHGKRKKGLAAPTPRQTTGRRSVG